jgi:hypothetical protein
MNLLLFVLTAIVLASTSYVLLATIASHADAGAASYADIGWEEAVQVGISTT